MMYLGNQAVGINNDNNDLQLLAIVNITEALENDTVANANTIYNNYIKSVVQNQPSQAIIYVISDNNTASAYALQKMIFTQGEPTIGIVLRKTGSTYTVRSMGSNISAWCGSGTILKIYVIKEVTSNA